MDECGEHDERGLLQKVVAPHNMRSAAEQVVRNKGAPGIDGMAVDELLPYLKKHYHELVGRILNDGYRASPVRRVEIPKPDGGKRLLGIPTVIDRMVQQAIAQVLAPVFEPVFSDHSYGFRPGRSAHDAVRKAYGYYEEGYRHVVDIDMAKYFDTINHDKLMNMLREHVDDKGLCRLIFRFLRSGVMKDGICSPTPQGAPQGGPLSPILSNIYLTKFDRLLEGRGLRFVRYADDCNIYVKSPRAAERVMASCSRFLEGTLKLKVNREKSQVGSPLKLKFLGFALYDVRGKSGIRIHEKSEKRFRDKVRDITKRNRGRSVESIFRSLKKYVVGWMGYYRLAALTSKAEKLDGWIRMRMRMYIWKQWKLVRTRCRNLRALGIDRERAWMWANSRKGYCRIAHSQVLSRSLTNAYLVKLGFVSLTELYKKARFSV